MSDFNERDKELLEKFGMTEEQVSSDVERMESEDAGPRYHRPYLLRSPHAAETGRAHGHRHHKRCPKASSNRSLPPRSGTTSVVANTFADTLLMHRQKN